MEDSDHPGESKEYTIEVELRAVNRGAFGTLHIGKCVELGREFALKRPILFEDESETRASNADTTRVRALPLPYVGLSALTLLH